MLVLDFRSRGAPLIEQLILRLVVTVHLRVRIFRIEGNLDAFMGVDALPAASTHLEKLLEVFLIMPCPVLVASLGFGQVRCGCLWYQPAEKILRRYKP
jgi:hypothetical protein